MASERVTARRAPAMTVRAAVDVHTSDVTEGESGECPRTLRKIKRLGTLILSRESGVTEAAVELTDTGVDKA